MYGPESVRTFRKLNLPPCLGFRSLGYKTELIPSQIRKREQQTENKLTFSFSFPLGLRSITLITNLLKSVEVCYGLFCLSLTM